MKLKVNAMWLNQLAETSKNPRTQTFKGYWRDQTEYVDTGMLTDDDMDKLCAIARKDAGHKLSGSLQKRIASYQAIMKGGGTGNIEVKNLITLETAMRNYLAKLPHCWVFREDVDGHMLPHVAQSVKYEPRDRRRDIQANVTLRLQFVKRGEQSTRSFTWYKEDVRGRPTVEQVLLKAGLFAEKPGMCMEYEEQMKSYNEWFTRTGMQFLAVGTADGRSMVADGDPSKVVMDDLITSDSRDEQERKVRNYITEQTVQADVFGKDEDADDEDSGDENEEEGEEKEEVVRVVDYKLTPVHPYLQMFRLEDHTYYNIHVANLQMYPWDTKVQEKLVLSEEKKDLINILITSAGEVMEDIVKGKTGGVIVLASGPPGTGKTLTAEVYCETTQSPLYSVQCSQLGTDEEEVEAELKRVLRRAMRWKAILLIDEADVYVRHRGEDIQQNAIVGVFLRILERYRGILFLTTNRATIVDDAILSRLTAHLRYEMPNAQELTRIWQVLSANYKVELSDALIKELVSRLAHVSGRSVKNMLKLGSVILKKEKTKPNAEFFVRMSRFLDVEQVKNND